MIITENITLSHIIKGTWKSFLFILLTCIGAYLLNIYAIRDYFSIPALFPTILGTALAFFIGFNNNQAYDRWWEARKIWGSIVNDSRSWARQLVGMMEATSRDQIKSMIFRQIAFVQCLKANLREQPSNWGTYLEEEELTEYASSSNIPNALLLRHAQDINLLYTDGVIDGFRFEQLNENLTRLCDHMGKAERISKTVFPTTYNYYTKLFIWFFILSVTMVLDQSIGGWGIVFGSLVGYVFVTIHTIGQVLLNPFDNLPTGIPLDAIARTIEINLLEMSGEKDLPQPIEPHKGGYIT